MYKIPKVKESGEETDPIIRVVVKRSTAERIAKYAKSHNRYFFDVLRDCIKKGIEVLENGGEK
jgi:hypothetical protein